MTGLERDTLVALNGIHKQLCRIADHYEATTTQQNSDRVETEDKADDRSADIVRALYTSRQVG